MNERIKEKRKYMYEKSSGRLAEWMNEREQVKLSKWEANRNLWCNIVIANTVYGHMGRANTHTNTGFTHSKTVMMVIIISRFHFLWFYWSCKTLFVICHKWTNFIRCSSLLCGFRCVLYSMSFLNVKTTYLFITIENAAIDHY